MNMHFQRAFNRIIPFVDSTYKYANKEFLFLVDYLVSEGGLERLQYCSNS